MQKTYVMYHGNCHDGFGAAWTAHKVFGDQADYIPAFHGEKLPSFEKGSHVYFLDFVPEKESLLAVRKVAEKLIVIDHHKTSSDRLDIAHETSFDLEHSGATLAWKYFFPNLEVPKLLRYVEDIDLWRFTLPEARETILRLNLEKHHFDSWDKFDSDINDDTKRAVIIQEGSLLLRKADEEIAYLLTLAETVKLDEFECLAINSPLHESKLGHEMALKKPPFALVWSRKRGQIHISLRGDGSIDTSEIAKRHGGGGHKNASGFTIKCEDLWSVITRIERGEIQ